ncbi:MAG TPA: SPOR domain-containing protein, partial [Sphingomonadaceae bacterium]|nr:SPOR domain-containing protein [Sphingomonadaceae bacterium]
YWVQVASGKNKGDLGKAWQALVAKQPRLLRGRDTWTTPWRASNRLLIGPFKTDDAAQALVNQLAKAGLITMQLTTRAGVPVERLDTK